VPAAPPPAPDRVVKVYGHSTLFYWWPVWALGFLCCAVTYFSGGRTAVLHKDAVYDKKDQTIKLKGAEKGDLVLSVQYDQDGKFYEHMSPSKGMGVVFVILVVIVIFITSVPLRGVSSAVFIAAILVFTLFFALMGWWDDILSVFGRLSVHMNAGFYGFISGLLFLVWAAVVFGFDRMQYWRVTPGQITHEFVFGGGQTSYDTEGIAFKKLRDDIFRHWVLGLGSGDLVMYPMQKATGSADDMSIHNVLFIGSKVARIQKLIAQKPDDEKNA
jgi:hypothetical protein